MKKPAIVSLVLAAGRGRRMQLADLNKVCHDIAGEPVICRALKMCEQNGISKHVVVVGHLADQVRAAVAGSFSQVEFVEQSELNGTGGAARCGARILQEQGYKGSVFVVAGDKVLEGVVVRRLIGAMEQASADLVFLTGEKSDNPASGRVLKDGAGRPVAIVEQSEIALSKLLAELQALVDREPGPVSCEAVLERMRAYFPEQSKLEQACGKLLELATEGGEIAARTFSEAVKQLLPNVEIGIYRDGREETFRAHEVEEMTDEVNLSVYLFSADALYDGLEHLRAHNAQGEEYLPDVVKYLASAHDSQGQPQYRLAALKIERPQECMGFNTIDELQRIRGYYAGENRIKVTKKQQRPQMFAVEHWQEIFAGRSPGLKGFLHDMYGDDAGLREAKREQYLTSLEHYRQNYGAGDQVFIVRSPGRINLMGRHVDHRGGDVNVIAISDECVAVVSPRQDDIVELSNSMPDRFAENRFSIGEMARNLELRDWFTCINSPKTLALVNNGDWENYIKAATLRLQERFSDRKLKGMRMTVHSNVPIGSGLSSSSAIVVAAAEACVTVNDLPVQSHLLVDLCGEGEWFVGTRGGSGDHAAIKMGRRGEVARMGFFGFKVKGFVPFPEGYRIVIIDSGIMAQKMQTARAEFNSRVLAYVVGEILFKLTYPQFADRIEHLRDMDTQNLEVTHAQLYEMLMGVPREVAYEDIAERREEISELDQERLAALLATELPKNGPLCVRDILLYGISEVKRSRLCSEYLGSGDLESFGRMCYVSHDGDRVVQHDENLQASPWNYRVSDEYLAGLIEGLQSHNPKRREACKIQWQPGRYACSVPTIDLIVDMARQMPGVLGAQMAGAGLGGCAMAFVEEGRCEEVVRRYKQKGFEARTYSPVQGAGLVTLP